MLDVGARLTTSSEHQHRLRQHRASIMHRCPLTGPRDRRRQGSTRARSGQRTTQRVQPDMGDDLPATGLHDHVVTLLPFTSRVPSRFES